MSSTILYKFRSGTTFEALSLPGNNARLLDIKKAIVTAKRLDQGSMDFDLSVKDATSGIEYMDDTAILPRGTRIVVQRLPSARGQGILAKIARSQFGDRAGTGNQTTVAANGPNADFYTIDSRVHDEDEEFVSTSVISPPPPSTDDSELAALRAATDTSMSGGPGRGIGRGGITLRGGPMSSSGGGFRPNQPAGLGPPPSRGLDAFLHAKPNHRPDADPEIREQEHQPQKKRATGIPRTFLSVSAPQGTDGSEGAVIIQPNTFVFEELVTRGGGQSENTAGTKRDLDYALKITATPIPEYLQCAICHNVVRDAMMLPWDPEGRTTCEQCIRTALTENGFRCPLTQQEGVSPDDLLPNHALRKAAVQFVKDVMEKMKEIDQHAETEEDINIENDKQNLIEGDLNDKGVVLTRRAAAAEKRKQDNDDFAGDDDFGGDVFAVEAEKTMDDNVDDPMITETNALDTNTTIETNLENEPLVDNFQQQAGLESEEQTKTEPMEVVVDANIQDSRNVNDAATSSTIIDTQSHRLTTRRRGPPVGYTMGPAIAVVQSPTEPDNDRGQPFDRGSYRGRRGGRMPYNGGRGFRGRYDSHSTASRYIVREENFSNGDANQADNAETEESRATKRVRTQSESGNDDVSTNNEERDHPQENWDGGGDDERGMIPRAEFRNHGRTGRWSGRGNRDVGFENRPGRWDNHGGGGSDDAAPHDDSDSQQDNWSSADTYRARGDFRSHGRGGRWNGRSGRGDGFEGRPGRWEGTSDGRYARGSYRGYRGGREEFRGGTYRGGDYQGYRGGRGGYRGGGRGRY